MSTTVNLKIPKKMVRKLAAKKPAVPTFPFIIHPLKNTDIHFNVSRSKDDDEQYAIAMQPSSENNCFEGKYYCGVVSGNIPISLGGVLPAEQYGIERERTRSFIQIKHEMDFASLTWTSAYNKLDYSAGQDQTYSGLESVFSFSGFFSGGSPFEPATAWHTFDSDSTKDRSHEVRLAGEALGDKLYWSVGAYYYKAEDAANLNNSFSEVTNKAFMGSLEIPVYRSVQSILGSASLT